tara:strand:- start:155 stop:355 length:201 start_codon:yes stop_codon:yes gene_type:complete
MVVVLDRMVGLAVVEAVVALLEYMIQKQILTLSLLAAAVEVVVALLIAEEVEEEQQEHFLKLHLFQ